MIGDHLLNANRQLSETLDGVYRPAEIYLRVMQRLSAAAFSNRVGRFLTRFVAVPFGGAFVVLEGAKHLAHEFMGSGHAAPSAASAGAATTAGAAQAAAHSIGWGFWAWLLLGMFILGMVNFAGFRAWVGRGFKRLRDGISQSVNFLAPLVPVAFLRRVVRSRAFLFTGRYILKPALFTALAWFTLNALDFTQHQSPFGLVMLFTCVNLLLNSRLGRDAEEITNDMLGRVWVEFRVRVLAGLFWFVVDLFKSLLEGVDRLLYAVDEWLRFKSGESALSFAAKAVFGSLWFVLSYVVRFCLNLLIEPQINPIKHFPVVTVSHKLLFPVIPLVAKVFEQVGYDTVASYGMATTFIWCIPGIFGFLVWELKENWKLYRANRSTNLEPAIIGAHGETLLRYLKPGFHSGTLPKLYRKLRRAERKGYWTGEKTTARKQLEQLEHVKETLRHFVERELTALLAESRAWSPRVTVGDVHAGSNSIRVELRCHDLGPASAWVAFDEQSGWLAASLSEAGWTASLTGRSARFFATP